MKIRGIGENGQIRRGVGGGGQELAILAVDAGNMANHLYEADHCQAGGVYDGTDAGGAQSRAGAAEELGAREQARELGDNEGSVEVAGGFTRGYENSGHL